MRPTLPAIAACALLLAPASARAAEPGWIEGTVRLGNDLVDRHSRFTLYADKYYFKFMPVAGSSYSDQGYRVCTDPHP